LGKFEGSFVSIQAIPDYYVNAEGSINFVTKSGSKDSGSTQAYVVSPSKGIKQIFKDDRIGYEYADFIDSSTLLLVNEGYFFDKQKAAIASTNEFTGTGRETDIDIQLRRLDSERVLPGIGGVLVDSESYQIIGKSGFYSKVIKPTGSSNFIERGYNGSRSIVTKDHEFIISTVDNSGVDILSENLEEQQTITLGTPKLDKHKKPVAEYTYFPIPTQLPSGTVVVQYANYYDDGAKGLQPFGDFVDGAAILKKDASGKYTKIELNTSNFSAEHSLSRQFFDTTGTDAVELDSNTLVLHGYHSISYFNEIDGSVVASITLPSDNNVANDDEVVSLYSLIGNRVAVRTEGGLYILDSHAKVLAHISSEKTRIEAFHELPDGRLVFAASDKPELDALNPADGTISVLKTIDWVPAPYPGKPSDYRVSIQELGKKELVGAGLYRPFESYGIDGANFAIIDASGNTNKMKLHDTGGAFVSLQDQSGVIHIGDGQVELIKFSLQK
jgi:hypothetical protein